MKKMVEYSDLSNQEICYVCLASGMLLEDALHNPKDMKSGPITSNRKCPQCFDTEYEFGMLPVTSEEKVVLLEDAMLEELAKTSN